MLQYNSNFITALRYVPCNEVLIILVNLCEKRVSVCHRCNGPFKNNGLPFPKTYDLVGVTKMRREYFRDGKKQMFPPSNVYFHVFHENPFPFLFECVQRCMITFQVDSSKLHWDGFKSISDVDEIYFQYLKVPIPAVKCFT